VGACVKMWLDVTNNLKQEYKSVISLSIHKLFSALDIYIYIYKYKTNFCIFQLQFNSKTVDGDNISQLQSSIMARGGQNDSEVNSFSIYKHDFVLYSKCVFISINILIEL
jgi:hypothetical protein